MKEKIKLLNQKLKEFQEQIDLKKHFPGYFNQWIFRGIIILMLVFTFFVIASNDFKIRNVYVECVKNTSCNNPLYICPENENSIPAYMRDDCVLKEMMPKEFLPLCEQGACSKETLSPGESYGNKPNFFVKNYNTICLLLALSAFIINHLLYKLNKGKNFLIENK